MGLDFIMAIYLIKTPEGNLTILAETIYHAVQLAVERTGYRYSNSHLLKINGHG